MKPTTTNLPAFGAKASQRGLAAVLGCDPSVINGLFARGVLPAGGRIIDWLRAAWAHRGEVAAGRAGDGAAELIRQKARLAKADADLREAALAKEYGTLVHVGDLEADLAAWVISMRAEVETAFDRFTAEVEQRHGVSVDPQYVDEFVAALLDRLAAPDLGGEPVAAEKLGD